MAADAEVVDRVDQALRDWAHWIMLGRSAAGFSRCNVLHKSWMPPTPGRTPTMAVSTVDDRRHRLVHQAIGHLSLRLSNTVVVHYCYRLSVAEQCQRLDCAPSTVHARLQVARTHVGRWLDEARTGEGR